MFFTSFLYFQRRFHRRRYTESLNRELAGISHLHWRSVYIGSFLAIQSLIGQTKIVSVHTLYSNNILPRQKTRMRLFLPQQSTAAPLQNTAEGLERNSEDLSEWVENIYDFY